MHHSRPARLWSRLCSIRVGLPARPSFLSFVPSRSLPRPSPARLCFASLRCLRRPLAGGPVGPATTGRAEIAADIVPAGQPVQPAGPLPRLRRAPAAAPPHPGLSENQDAGTLSTLNGKTGGSRAELGLCCTQNEMNRARPAAVFQPFPAMPRCAVNARIPGARGSPQDVLGSGRQVAEGGDPRPVGVGALVHRGRRGCRCCAAGVAPGPDGRRGRADPGPCWRTTGKPPRSGQDSRC